MRNHAMALAAGLFAAPVCAQLTAPVKELGSVDFARDLDAVLKQKPTRPIFLQFQEIPG